MPRLTAPNIAVTAALHSGTETGAVHATHATEGTGMNLHEHRSSIDAHYAAGASFDDIEDWVNELPLPHEHVAALWLYAVARQR